MDRPDLEPDQPPPPLSMKKPNLTSEERRSIVSALLLTVKPGDPNLKLSHGALTAVARDFNVNRKTIKKIWDRALANYHDSHVRAFVSSPQKRTNSGRKQLYDRDEVRAAIKQLPLYQRKTLRSLAAALGISKSTLFRMKESKLDKVIVPSTIALKPLLTEEHKLQRVLYCVSHLNPIDNKYNDFYDNVHIDEKWFFISEKQLRVYIAADERHAAQRYAQNHNQLLKVMFLCPVARPRFNEEGVCTFDGKIGIWPFVEYIAARRSSRNRERGVIVTTPVSCTRDRYRRMLIEKVIPAIRAKWPDRNRRITIQQDGASSHIADTDREFREHARQGVWNIQLVTQSAKSPDVNVLDLSFFRALQSAQWRLGCEVTIDGLIRQTMQAYNEFEPRLIDFGFLTLQCCIDDILRVNGGNDYKLRHMGKEALLRAGRLPVRIDASEAAVYTYRTFMLGGEQDAPAVNDEGAGDNDPGDDNGANNNLLQMIPLEAV